MNKINQNHERVNIYQNVYSPGSNPAIALIKIRVIQELIQIKRPMNWDRQKMATIVEDLIKMEKYIATKTHNTDKFLRKWRLIL
jgi:hypothetical protein